MDAKATLLSYVNKWVALTRDNQEIAASASDLKQLDRKVKKARLKDVIYHYVVPPDKSFSP